MFGVRPFVEMLAKILDANNIEMYHCGFRGKRFVTKKKELALEALERCPLAEMKKMDDLYVIIDVTECPSIVEGLIPCNYPLNTSFVGAIHIDNGIGIAEVAYSDNVRDVTRRGKVDVRVMVPGKRPKDKLAARLYDYMTWALTFLKNYGAEMLYIEFAMEENGTFWFVDGTIGKFVA